MTAPIRVIRSARRTLALEIRDGEILVRAPYRVSARDIDAFVRRHSDWIESHLKKAAGKQAALSMLTPLSEAEMKTLAKQAKALIPARVAYYAPLVGVDYGRISVRFQRTRWGSCSAKGSLSFNALLLLAPPEVLDSVIVHELCHRKEMNHGAAFYREVLRVFPEYRKWNKWLKENGNALQGRALHRRLRPLRN